MCGNYMSVHIPEGKKPMIKYESKHDLKTSTNVKLPSDPTPSSDLKQSTDLELSTEIKCSSDLKQPTDLELSTEIKQYTDLNELTDLKSSMELNTPTDLMQSTDLPQIIGLNQFEDPTSLITITEQKSSEELEIFTDMEIPQVNTNEETPKIQKNLTNMDNFHKKSESGGYISTFTEIYDTITPTLSEFASTNISVADFWDQILEALETLPRRPKSFPQINSRQVSFLTTKSFSTDAIYVKYLEDEFFGGTPLQDDNWTDDFKIIRELSENKENLRYMMDTPLKNLSSDTLNSEEDIDDTPSLIEKLKEVQFNVNNSFKKIKLKKKNTEMNKNICSTNKDFQNNDCFSTPISHKISQPSMMSSSSKTYTDDEEDHQLNNHNKRKTKIAYFNNSDVEIIPQIRTTASSSDWKIHPFDEAKHFHTGIKSIKESNFDKDENLCLLSIYRELNVVDNFAEHLKERDMIKSGSSEYSDESSSDYIVSPEKLEVYQMCDKNETEMQSVSSQFLKVETHTCDCLLKMDYNVHNFKMNTDTKDIKS